MKIDKIVFATGNEGKMREIRMIMEDLGPELLSMKQAGVDVDIVEDGETFEENAMIKASAIAQALREDGVQAVVLADDSGLEVDYLNKEPGVYSARYMGEDTSYTVKNANLIQRLEGVPDEERTARFVCVIAAVFPDGRKFATRAGSVMRSGGRTGLATIRYSICRSTASIRQNLTRRKRTASATGERRSKK